jgi:AcrR family transcriptional regulator
MPKVVDAAGRRTDLAEAVWRVIRRDGLDRASVRNVAQEAGLSMGSLRHYFGAQSDLLIFAMRLVIERIGRRVAALDLPEDPRLAAERVLAELLPLDAERRAENEVWLAFTARALVDPRLRALRDEGYDLLRDACRRQVLRLAGPRPVKLDVDLETDRLFALLDGLAVHAAMRPTQASPDRLTAVLARHLDALAASTTPSSHGRAPARER